MEDTEKIYTECITAFNRESIIKCAKRDEETPFGFLLSYLKRKAEHRWDSAKSR